MLNSQGDEELIFSGASGQNLQVLKIYKTVNDIAWATSASGTLYTTDSGATRSMPSRACSRGETCTPR